MNDESRLSADARLSERIRLLEADVDALRLSRRVLMRLLEESNDYYEQELAGLRRENERLRKKLCRIAHARWQSRENII